MRVQQRASVISTTRTYHLSNDKAIIDLWCRSTESRAALCLYFYCRARLGGGVLYSGAHEQTLEKMGWSRTQFYRNVARMKAHHLISEDIGGNYQPMKTADFRGLLNSKSRYNYKTTLMLARNCTMREVKDALTSKFFERRGAQLTKTRGKRGALILATRADLRKPSSKPFYAKPRGDGSFQISTRQLAKHLFQSRSSVIRWRKRCRDIVFSQSTRREGIGSCHPSMNARRYGGTYMDKEGNIIKVHPSSYTLLMPYLPHAPKEREIQSRREQGRTNPSPKQLRGSKVRQ